MLSYRTHGCPRTNMYPTCLYSNVIQSQLANIHHFMHPKHVTRIHQQVCPTCNNSTSLLSKQCCRFSECRRAMIGRDFEHTYPFSVTNTRSPPALHPPQHATYLIS